MSMKLVWLFETKYLAFWFFLELLKETKVNPSYYTVKAIDHLTHNAFDWKIQHPVIVMFLLIPTVAVDRLPNFLAMPTKSDNSPGPNHTGTIHLNCERTSLINEAHDAALKGEIPEKWVFWSDS